MKAAQLASCAFAMVTTLLVSCSPSGGGSARRLQGNWEMSSGAGEVKAWELTVTPDQIESVLHYPEGVVLKTPDGESVPNPNAVREKYEVVEQGQNSVTIKIRGMTVFTFIDDEQIEMTGALAGGEKTVVFKRRSE